MMKKPSQGLKTKIFRPFFLLIMTLSLMILLAFNVSMRVYMNRVAFSEIEKSRETVKTLLKNELMETNGNNGETRTQDLVQAINRSFRLTVTTTGNEMAILGTGGSLILPKATDLSTEMLAFVNQVSEKLEKGESSGTYNMTFDGISYLVSFGKYTETALNAKGRTLVLIASKETATLLIRRTNFMMLLILSLTTLVGLLLSNRLANDITRPIKSVSDYAQKLTKGQYETMTFTADTSEVHSLYENLNNMSETLKNREKTKIDFIQNYSHDLRTPLMSIQGYAEGIKSGVFEDTAKAAGIIADESMRLTHLVDQLITLSRLDLPDHRREWTNVDLFHFLGILIERHEGYATKEQKKIFLECPKELKLFTSEDLLEKVVSNLLGNAIRFAHAKVTIAVSVSSTHTRIALSDDGSGIPQDLMPNIFNRMVKGSEGQFGLGLSIAFAAAEQLEATLSAENTGNGVTFTLTHPNK